MENYEAQYKSTSSLAFPIWFATVLSSIGLVSIFFVFAGGLGLGLIIILYVLIAFAVGVVIGAPALVLLYCVLRFLKSYKGAAGQKMTLYFLSLGIISVGYGGWYSYVNDWAFDEFAWIIFFALFGTSSIVSICQYSKLEAYFFDVAKEDHLDFETTQMNSYEQ